MEIKLAVFDIAGTTLHDEANVAKVLQKAIQLAGVHVSLEEVNEVMGYAKPYAIRYLLQQKNDPRYTDDSFVNELHTRFVEDMKAHYATDTSVREKQGVSAVFAALRQKGIKVALDTGFDRDITNVILNRTGWQQQGLIDAVTTSDEVTYGRPYPYMIYRIMETLEVRSIGEVMKVGDTISDLEEGTNAGCRYVVGVTTGAYSREELEKGPHTHLVASLDELLSIL
ncbi:phosphonatase-like hydrolase [Chitinophaga qingshengii]|uniref:Phosphonatase-like hydrolase n=1 Tax=Chitinophaga qingshengii TaxID=1569794 RepID=A0ABR7TJP5_9BACT|nr:phosphonatase-like hydrolase [Chitinophaga qingshengii]MBC9930711.1 phosphonatase-like hydrolase [Chitinophaga qingshengii]